MPAAEVEVTEDLVRQLLTDQKPELAAEPIIDLAHGWDNISFRVGDDLVARFPRRQLAAGLVENEARWLPTFADRLPLPIPAPTFLGRPGRGFPWSWVLAPWIEGVSAATAGDLDLTGCARDLGLFMRALHQPAPDEAPFNPFRGVPLQTRDEVTRRRIEMLGESIDPQAVAVLWEEALRTPPHRGPALWIHGDLHPHNLLVEGGKLSGVVDFGDVTAGDPATDLAVAWMLFGPADRELLMASYGKADEECWARAKGWALALALAYLANSADNPVMHAIGEKTSSEVLGVS